MTQKRLVTNTCRVKQSYEQIVEANSKEEAIEKATDESNWGDVIDEEVEYTDNEASIYILP